MGWLADTEIRRSAKAVAEAECAERAAKTARLKLLRTQIFLPEADFEVSFIEEIDCSLVVAALTEPKESATSRTPRLR